MGDPKIRNRTAEVATGGLGASFVPSRILQFRHRAGATATFSDHDFKKQISPDTISKTMEARDPGLAIHVQNATTHLGWG